MTGDSRRPPDEDVLWTVSPWKTRGATTWVSHRVLRRTGRFVFVLDVLRRATLRLDREALERDGSAYSRSRGRTYYTAAAKERCERRAITSRADTLSDEVASHLEADLVDDSPGVLLGARSSVPLS